MILTSQCPLTCFGRNHTLETLAVSKFFFSALLPLVCLVLMAPTTTLERPTGSRVALPGAGGASPNSGSSLSGRVCNCPHKKTAQSLASLGAPSFLVEASNSGGGMAQDAVLPEPLPSTPAT